MDFCFTWNISEPYNFGMFLFSHTFSVKWETNYPKLWELHGFLFYGNISETLKFWMFVFSLIFPYYGNCFPLVFGVVFISRKNLSKRYGDGKYMGTTIYFSWNAKTLLKLFQKPTAWERYGFPQIIFVLWEVAHSHTWVFINSKSGR